ncbi:MAG: prolipoprotein diacylglyceryl transferase [bacterium]
MFLRTYHPNPILLNLGPLKIYWYGFIIVIGIFIAFAVSEWLLKKYQKSGILTEIDLADITLCLLICGLIGARLFHVISEWQYYFKNPLDIFKVWNGGLWIYGAIAVGLFGFLIYTRNFNKEKNFLLLDIIAPGIIIAQSIGRWGNYFNQELYGIPTNSIFGLPVDFIHRIKGFEIFFYFHPVFLYESLWCLLVGITFIYLHLVRIKRKETNANYRIKAGNIFLLYLFLYSLGRFYFEFLRIDTVFLIYSFRSTQLLALAAIVIAGIFLVKNAAVNE